MRPTSTALKSLFPHFLCIRAEQGGGRVRLPLPGLRYGSDAGRDVQRRPQDQGARRRASQDVRLALVVSEPIWFFGLLDRFPYSLRARNVLSYVTYDYN